MKDLSCKFAMLCPLCGNVQFRCSDCSSVFTENELIAGNAEVPDNALEEMTDDILKKLRKEVKSW